VARAADMAARARPGRRRLAWCEARNRECEGAALAIVALVLWVITAAAGVSLLSTGGAARRSAAAAARAQADGEQGPAGAPSVAAEGAPATASASSAVAGVRSAGIPARYAAVPLTDDGRPPPVPRVRVATPPGEHPLLEFSHPAMAVFGLAGWFAFVFVHYRPFAWFSLGILVVTIGLGLSWLIRNAQAVRHQAIAAWRFPRRLVLLHGAAAAIGISLTVLTALSVAHG
jgi:hypothetical protein